MNQKALTEDHRESKFYEICLKGHLNPRWMDKFAGLSFIYESDGTTILSGPVVDQAALHGLLRIVRDLALPLVSVNQIELKQVNVLVANIQTKNNHSTKEKNS
ncbi:hypothetical protein AM499_15330 [Bacillus sp. FJAT-22090]|uniref:hypothetical protein n=1 Tax=Bacillus sp. FJAT-22090 TaxID=1581038 RepID=UPI0006AEAD53|nr:hypothetical protein [Bacillus sp. FJAT-22090]ALC87039.1 hypothetical protein AM499_15330 [Bacillus sp. FJAT-22090]